MLYENATIDCEPELLHLPPELRNVLMQRSRRRMLHNRRFLLGVLVRLVLTFALPVGLIFVLQELATIGAALALFIAIRLLAAYVRHMQRQALAAEMLDWHLCPTHCLKCGYDLRASCGRCPECGDPIANGQMPT